MRIGIDIDGTITDNFQLIKNLACQHFNKCEEDITGWDWDFSKVFNISQQEAQAFWNLYEEKIYTIPGPKPHAIEVITHLATKHEIIYITARSRSFAEQTVEWLKERKIYFGNIFMDEDKHKICTEQAVSIMIDDSPEYVSLTECIPLFMFDYPYNRHIRDPRVIKVNSWLEIKEKIEIIEKL